MSKSNSQLQSRFYVLLANQCAGFLNLVSNKLTLNMLFQPFYFLNFNLCEQYSLQAAEVAHSLFCMCYKFNLQVENATNLLLLAEIHKVQYYIYHTICLEPRGLGLTFRPSPKAYTYTKQCLSGEKETKEIRLTIVSTIV